MNAPKTIRFRNVSSRSYVDSAAAGQRSRLHTRANNEFAVSVRLIASKKVAWVFDAEGKRNIRVAEAPEVKGRRPVRF